MKETGVIRRIDELGRIVIPKEIRRRLKITTGDQIDISINDRFILLNKYEPLEENISNIKLLTNTISQRCGFDIVMFDNMKCVISTIDNINENDYILDDLLEKIRSNEKLEYGDSIDIPITSNYINNKNLVIKRIMCNYEYMGCLMLFKDSVIGNNDYVLLDMIRDFIVNLNKYDN